MYNLAAFTSSFLYSSVEVGTVVAGIVVVGVVACRGRDGEFRGKVS